MSTREQRVAEVVALGARLADARDPLGREARHALLRTSGLSPEGVELALGAHLETALSSTDLASLLTWAGASPRCWLVLSANVPTAALRAFALGLAAAPVLRVRPSRRDPALAPLLARELAASGLDVSIVPSLDAQPGDQVHAYGSDETLSAIAAELPPGVRFRGHGTGLGVALIGPTAALDDAARALASDLVAFDQRGCLSPRFALVDGDEHRVTAFFNVLHQLLLEHGERAPRGPLDQASREALALYQRTAQALGEAVVGPHHLLGLDLAPRALLLPPPARALHLAPISAATIGPLLAPFAPFLTTVGSLGAAPLLPALRALAPGARFCALGHMQRPPLDGPVDLRPWPRPAPP
jgi:hypothetical protein